MSDERQPDPAQVATLVAMLEKLTDQQYAEALADCVMDPDVDEQAAFRSEVLAYRSMVAARYLIDNVNTSIRRKDDESNKTWIARAEHFRHRVGMERRLLEHVVAGLRAQRGQLPNQPNPRARAMRALAAKYPVEFLDLVRIEQQKDAEAAKVRKVERQASKRKSLATAPQAV